MNSASCPRVALLTGSDIWSKEPHELLDLLVTAAGASIPLLRTKIQGLVRGEIFWILEGERLHPSLVEEVTGQGDLVHGVLIIETDERHIREILQQRAREPIAEDLVRCVAAVDSLYGSWLLDEARRRGLRWVRSRPWETLPQRIQRGIRHRAG